MPWLWKDANVPASSLILLAKMIVQIYLRNESYKIGRQWDLIEWDLMPPAFLPMEKLMWFCSEACINLPAKLVLTKTWKTTENFLS